MKTQKVIIGMLLMVMSMGAFATEGEKRKAATPKMEVISDEVNIYKVLFMGKGDAKTTINIWNENKLVYTETIKKLNAFVRPYNFSQMPEGTYTLEIIEGNSISKKVIYHGVDAPVFMEELTYPKVIKIDPLTGEEAVYKLTIVNPGKVKANIKIYDGNQKEVYNMVESFENIFSQLYNLKEIGVGAIMEIGINGDVKRYAL